MDRQTLVIIVILLICVIGSFPAVARSRKKQKIYSGTIGQLFHHIGTAAYIGVAPAALIGSLVVGPLRFGIPFAIGLLGVAFVMLFCYALFEKSARAGLDLDEQLWTQDDAKTSGL